VLKYASAHVWPKGLKQFKGQISFLLLTTTTSLLYYSFKSNLSEMCFRCDTVFCSFLHCTWLCMKVRPFWHDISSTLTRITGVHVPVNPELCLLGNFTSIRRSLNSAQHKFIEIALTVTKKCIAVSWKSDSPLLIDRWSVEMNSCITL
jgi:hypothetical protein